jgi:uncharacterized protein YjbI with pentapeptide repeats
MIFLGKIFLESGGMRLGVKPDGNLAMFDLKPDDPAGIFLAYDVGSGWFSLRSYRGWVQLVAGESPKAWYPVLYAANVGSNPTRFALQFLNSPNGTIKLAFRTEDGFNVALLKQNGINPYCNCEFDVGASWNYGMAFNIGLLAPGLKQLNETKNGVAYDFSCLGEACVDFSGFEFFGVNFTDANFSGVCMKSTSYQGCTLTRARFWEADLTSTNFQYSKLAAADFTGCDLNKGTVLPNTPLATDPANRTIFRNTKLPVALLNKNWSYLDLTGAELIGLQEADLNDLVAHYVIVPEINLSNMAAVGADFSNADLTGSKFQKTNLKDAKFISGTLTGCLFNNAILVNSCFDVESSLPTSTCTDLIGAKFNGANLSGCSLRHALLWDAAFIFADLKDADFSHAQLGSPGRGISATFAYAYLENAKMDYASLFGVNFSYVTFFGSKASIRNAQTIEQANFSNSYLSGIDFTDSNMRGANFSGACLVNAILKGVDLQPSTIGSVPSSFVGAVIQGAEFTQSKLNYANMANAAVALIPGRLPIRFCNEDGYPYPTPPATLSLVYKPTTNLDLNTLGDETICPNGYSVKENQQEHRSIAEMLSSPNAATDWFPTKCRTTVNQR